MTEFITTIGNGNLIVLDVPDDPVERGNIVGNALKEQIIGLFNRWCSSCDGKMKEQPGTMEVRALSYATQIWPLICKHAPSSAKEINAMANATKIPLLVFVALNAYDEMGLVAPIMVNEEANKDETNNRYGHCSGAAFVNGILGENYDCPLYYNPIIILRSPSNITLTFPGIIGGPFMNKEGLTSLWFTVVPNNTKRMYGVPNAIMLREFQFMESVQEAEMYFQDIPRCAGTCFVLRDSTSPSVYILEATPIDYTMIKEENTHIAHSNHYLSEKFKDIDMYQYDAWTVHRCKRMTELLENANEEKSLSSIAGQISFLKSALADVKGKEQGISICEYAEHTNGDWETLASIIFDPINLQVWIKAGRPDNFENDDWLVTKMGDRNDDSKIPLKEQKIDITKNILTNNLQGKNIKAAVLCPLLRDAYNIKFISVTLKALHDANISFHLIESNLLYSSRDDDEAEFNMCGYVKECEQYCLENNIDIVIATRDMADICHAALCQILPNKFNGPSVFSIFTALDKLRTHQLLDPMPIPYGPVKLNDLNSIPFYPCFLKPRTASCSQLASQVTNEKEGEEMLRLMECGLPSLTRYLPAFLQTYLPQVDVEELTNTVLAEEFMDQNTYKVTVDGCVGINGRDIYYWGVTDSNYYDTNIQCFDNCTFPSIFSGTLVEEVLKKTYIQVVQNICTKGFKQQFIDVEFFIRGSTMEERCKSENIRVMEVNSRSFVQLEPVYNYTLFNGSQLETLLLFGVGKNLDVSPYPNGLVGSNYYINVMMPKNPDISFLGSDLFNFDLANELDEYIEIKIKPTDSLSWSVANNKSGLTLAMFYIYSFSREANERRAKEIRKLLVLKESMLPS